MMFCSDVAFLAGTHSDEVLFPVELLPRPFKQRFWGQTSPAESAKWSFDVFPAAQRAQGWERGGDIQMKQVTSGFLCSLRTEIMLME